MFRLKLITDWKKIHKWVGTHIAIVMLVLQGLQQEYGQFMPFWATGLLSAAVIIGSVFEAESKNNVS